MRRLWWAILVLLGGALRAHALGDPKTLEIEYTWSTYFSSFTSVTSRTDDVAGLGSKGYSTNFSTPNVVGFKYSVYPLGGTANFTISQTTKTYNSAAVNASGFNSQWPGNLAGGLIPSVSTTTLITVPSGITYNGEFEAKTLNPVFTWSGLSTAATYYLWVEYGIQRGP